MSEKSFGILVSTGCGAILGFLICYVLLGNGSGMDYLEPARIFISLAGSFFFGLAGLASGVLCALLQHKIGSSAIGHILVGGIPAGVTMALLWNQLEMGDFGLGAWIFLGAICALNGLVFRSTCRFHERHLR
jgi:hypothetical protein